MDFKRRLSFYYAMFRVVRNMQCIFFCIFYPYLHKTHIWCLFAYFYAKRKYWSKCINLGYFWTLLPFLGAKFGKKYDFLFQKSIRFFFFEMTQNIFQKILKMKIIFMPETFKNRQICPIFENLFAYFTAYLTRFFCIFFFAYLANFICMKTTTLLITNYLP